MREAANKGNVQAEGWRIAKGDRKFYAKASLSPLKNDQGELIGFVKIVQDETERMQNLQKAEQQRKEIDQTARVLQGVTVQISAVSTQLSSSTAETTAALSETTATAEEAKQTADQTSMKAKAVSEESKAVAVASRQGLEATDATISGMIRIREQMESIAECMVQLSNQSKLIGDIIASVDDLAQQSNLLAVNASIEAAKAGEQGKGFAVVAQEVKNLSQQSKAATAHVRSILNDIVKATTAATMATEQGGKAVEVGHQQATEAGRVIKTLTDSIEKATQATELIEVSSQQQLVGMKQIVDALDSIRVASQQNLESANQLEGAGKELSSLGKQLVDLTTV
jgi:methyl-accepting chemotaxis protein